MNFFNKLFSSHLFIFVGFYKKKQMISTLYPGYKTPLLLDKPTLKTVSIFPRYNHIHIHDEKLGYKTNFI
jgi:hypothetical protein